MQGAIIVVVFSHYIISFVVTWVSAQTGISIPFLPLLLPPVLAGYLGAVQFVRTERKHIRLLGRLGFAFKSCLAIVLTPFVIGLILSLAGMLTGGFAMLQFMPEIAAFMTSAAIMATLIFIVYGLPALFIGISYGFWARRQLIQRKGYSAGASNRP